MDKKKNTKVLLIHLIEKIYNPTITKLDLQSIVEDSIAKTGINLNEIIKH